MFTNTLMKAWLFASCCMALVAGEFQMVELTGGKLDGTGATLETMVTLADEAAGGQDTITIRYTVPQLCWVAVGINPNSRMIDGEVVIGKTEENTVLKYKLNGKARDAIVEQPNQTLISASLEQDFEDVKTILTFTKLLVEEGEYSFVAGTVNTFIAAFGSSDTFGFHQAYGVQAVNVPSGLAPTPMPSLIEQVNATGSYSRLLGLIADLGLAGQLETLAPVTVLGPGDAAFAAVDLSDLTPTELMNALGAHVVQGYYTVADVMAEGCLVGTSIVGTPIRAMYVEEDTGGRKLAGHMAPSGYVMINEAKVILADISDDTNIFHGLDTVLTEEGPWECPEKSFVEQVAETGDYTTLIGFLSDPLLQAQLASAGPITVFGPNDAAFSEVGDVLNSLSAVQVQLALGSHVVSGVYTSADIKEKGCVMLQSVVGTSIRALYVEVDHGAHNHRRRLAGHVAADDEHETDHIMINEAKVILADIADDTSIFHGLDTVLLDDGPFECPTDAPAPTVAPAPTTAPGPSAKTDSASPSKIVGSILFTAFVSSLALIW